MLSDIPVLGPLLFSENALGYATYVTLMAVSRSDCPGPAGAADPGSRECPRAAKSTGIKVLRLRYLNTILGGAVAGLFGAYLTLGSAGSFPPNMTAGKGLIALAAVIFGSRQPAAGSRQPAAGGRSLRSVGFPVGQPGLTRARTVPGTGVGR